MKRLLWLRCSLHSLPQTSSRNRQLRAIPARPPADYDLRWGVKIPMRDKVELNATLYLPKTPDGSPPKTPVIFTLTPYISDTYHAAARTSPHTVMCSRLSMFAAAAIPAASSSRSQMNHATDTTSPNGWQSNHSATGKVAMWGGSYAGFDQWATAKEFPPHLATIVPAAAAHPGLDFPSPNNIGISTTCNG
jgi:predicted acyl esterase